MRRQYIGLVFLALILFSILPVTSNIYALTLEKPLLTKKFYGSIWKFYDDKVVVYVPESNETLTIRLIFAKAVKLCKTLGGFEFNYTDREVRYFYSFKHGSHSINITNIFRFALTPAVKIKTEIEADGKLPRFLKFSYSIKYHLRGLKNLKHRIKGRKLLFDWQDIVRHRIRHDVSKSLSSLSIDIDLSNKQRIIIDPLVAVSEGEAPPQDVIARYIDTSTVSKVINVVDVDSDSASRYCYGDIRPGQVFTIDYCRVVNVTITILKSGSPGDLVCELWKWDTSNNMPVSLIDNVTVPATDIPTSETLLNITFNNLIEPGTYAAIFHCTGDSSNYYFITSCNDDVYADGYLVVSTDGGSSYDSYSDDLRDFRVYVNPGYSETTSTVYSYYWAYSDSNATYRYDMNYTFPSSAIEREIKCTFPKGHDVLNVTLPNGTAITGYTVESFNSTHNVIVIPESTIATYGDSYILYTHAWNAIYDLFTNHTYYGYGRNATVYAVLRDPYGDPLSDYEVDFAMNFSKWYDISGNGNHGQIYGAKIVNDTELDRYVLGFDGDKDRVIVPHSDIIVPHPFTIEVGAIMRGVGVGSGENPHLVRKEYSYGLWVRESDYKIWGRIWQSDGSRVELEPTTTIELNKPFIAHLVADCSYLKLYVNAEFSTQASYDGTMGVRADYDLIIGNIYDLNDGWEGEIFLIRIYDRALTQQEIKQNYDSIFYGNTTPVTDGLVLWFEDKFLVDQAFASAVSDSDGIAVVNYTTPSEDAVCFITANCSGDYAGVKWTLIKVTDISYSIDVPDIVTKNESFTYSISAWATIDNREVDTIVVNGTSYTGGSISLSYTYTLSGHHNFTLNLEFILEGADKSLTYTKTLFVGGSVNWDVEKIPDLYYYIVNQNVTISIDVLYDNGERVSQTLYVYLDGSALASGPPPMNVSVIMDSDHRLYINFTDIDGRVYEYSLVLYMNVLLVDISSYGSLELTELTISTKAGIGVVGEHEWILYIAQPDNSREYSFDIVTSGNASKMAIQGLKLKQYNSSLVEVSTMLINYASIERSFNITFRFFSNYSVVLGEALVSVSIRPNDIASIVKNVTLDLSLDYPVYLNVSVISDDGEYLEHQLLTPIIKPDLRVVYYTRLDPALTSQKLTLALKDYVDPGKEVYAYVSIINDMKLTTKNSTVVKLQLPEQAWVSLSIEFNDNRIYESGDKVLVNITLLTYPQLSGKIRLYVDDKLVNEWDVTANTTITEYITVPQELIETLVDVQVKSEFQERVSEKTLATSGKILYVYNSGPTILLNSPPEGSTLNGTVTIDLAVSDNSGVASVIWKFDFEEAYHNVTETYDITIDTLKYPNGLARLIVIAYDTKGFKSQRTFYFNIYNKVTEARVFSIWESIGTLISRYAFLPAIAVSFVVLLLGYGLGRAMASRPKQPIIIRIESEKLKAKGEKK